MKVGDTVWFLDSKTTPRSIHSGQITSLHNFWLTLNNCAFVYLDEVYLTYDEVSQKFIDNIIECCLKSFNDRLQSLFDSKYYIE